MRTIYLEKITVAFTQAGKRLVEYMIYITFNALMRCWIFKILLLSLFKVLSFHCLVLTNCDTSSMSVIKASCAIVRSS